MVERLRARRPRVRVILISGYADDAIAAYGVMDPSITLINKPFQLHELTQRVREVLDAAPRDAAKHIPLLPWSCARLDRSRNPSTRRAPAQPRLRM